MSVSMHFKIARKMRRKIWSGPKHARMVSLLALVPPQLVDLAHKMKCRTYPPKPMPKKWRPKDAPMVMGKQCFKTTVCGRCLNRVYTYDDQGLFPSYPCLCYVCYRCCHSWTRQRCLFHTPDHLLN